jgi:hypothetical protein
MKFKQLSVILLVLACALCAFGQTAAPPAPPAATPVANVALPTYIMAGVSYNQYTGGAGFVSGIIPESQSVGVYGSATTDIVPIKYVNTATGKSGYVLSGSARAGQHKVVYSDLKNMVTLGCDLGASFSSAPAPSSGVNIGLAGSFTLTYIRQLSAHWAVGVPVRMLWLAGSGPNGSGAWNPVLEAGVVWKP